MLLHEININRFMRALFHKEYEDIDNWDELWLQFIDNSGMGQTRQSVLLTAMHRIEVRLSFVTSYINYQFEFIKLTGKPATHRLNGLNHLGHRLIWTGQPLYEELNNQGGEIDTSINTAQYQSLLDQFSIQLKRIDAKERRNKSEYDKLEKEYNEVKSTGVIAEDDRSRNDFVRMINAVSSHVGYRIDKENTDMEEFSLMISDYNNHLKSLEQQNSKK